MAGGMNKRGNWGAMADRVKHSAEPPGGLPSRAATPAVPTLKHCWVTDRHGRLPALLLEWRRGEAGFEGRVLRAVHEQDGAWVVVEEWLPAALLDPA